MEPLQRFSLFLTPGAADFAYLQTLVREVSSACGASPFEPHVTVYSGQYADPELVKKAVSGAVKGVGPLSLKAVGIGFSMEYLKSLFIEFEEIPLLRGVHDRVKLGLGEDSGYRLIPHLSLLYCEMPLAEKEALAHRIVLEKEEFLFDQVKVVAPRYPVEEWRDTGGWHTIFSARLEGRGLSGP